jgi:hypothetical protein
MWLLGRLVPDDKVIADFRRDNGPAIRKACPTFVNLCRQMGLRAKASVVIDGSKFKAVNNGDRIFTGGKIDRRRQQQSATVLRVSRHFYESHNNRSEMGGPASVVSIQVVEPSPVQIVAAKPTRAFGAWFFSTKIIVVRDPVGD